MNDHCRGFNSVLHMHMLDSCECILFLHPLLVVLMRSIVRGVVSIVTDTQITSSLFLSDPVNLG